MLRPSAGSNLAVPGRRPKRLHQPMVRHSSSRTVLDKSATVNLHSVRLSVLREAQHQPPSASSAVMSTNPIANVVSMSQREQHGGDVAVQVEDDQFLDSLGRERVHPGRQRARVGAGRRVESERADWPRVVTKNRRQSIHVIAWLWLVRRVANDDVRQTPVVQHERPSLPWRNGSPVDEQVEKVGVVLVENRSLLRLREGLKRLGDEGPPKQLPVEG